MLEHEIIIKTGINEYMKIEKTVDRGSKEKLYVQLYSIILEKIESGEWPAGTRIPPEDELCRIYDVSKVTVREAMQELVREGCLKRQQGKGTFVAYSVPQPGVNMRTRLSEDMYGEGVNVEKEILFRGFWKGAEEKEVLMTEDEIYRICVRKVVDGEIYGEEIFIPLFILPDIEQEDISGRSIYDLIEEKGTKKIFRVVQTVEFAEIKKEDAMTLKQQEGVTALVVSRILMSSDGHPIGITKTTGTGSSAKFQIEFERIR